MAPCRLSERYSRFGMISYELSRQQDVSFQRIHVNIHHQYKRNYVYAVRDAVPCCHTTLWYRPRTNTDIASYRKKPQFSCKSVVQSTVLCTEKGKLGFACRKNILLRFPVNVQVFPDTTLLPSHEVSAKNQVFCNVSIYMFRHSNYTESLILKTEAPLLAET